MERHFADFQRHRDRAGQGIGVSLRLTDHHRLDPKVPRDLPLGRHRLLRREPPGPGHAVVPPAMPTHGRHVEPPDPTEHASPRTSPILAGYIGFGLDALTDLVCAAIPHPHSSSAACG